MLPMDEKSRMARARDLGFTIPVYHGTGARFNEFDLDKANPNGAQGYAPYFADKHEEAKGYADMRGDGNGHVMDCLLRIRKPLMVPTRDMGEYPARAERVIPEKLYRAITGGPSHKEANREYDSTVEDALRHASRLGDDRRANWTAIYDRLRKLGFDAMVFTKIPSDFTMDHYTKFVMLDMSGIRLKTAAFDPAKADTISLNA